jgi:hypothetical protein
MKTAVKKIAGCFSHRRTESASARRRIGRLFDDDFALGQEDANPFVTDSDIKLGFSKALRREISKTQVVTSPGNVHIRCRRSHTDEVIGISTAIASILGLNIDLCRAIAMGHDIGHAPFGHQGEKFISQVTGRSFKHQVFGVVIAQSIERKGQGLNLTHQVLFGMLCHSRGAGDFKETEMIFPEANVVMNADKIAYITGDYNDIFNRLGGGKLNRFEKLHEVMKMMGGNHRQRCNFLVDGLCWDAAQSGKIEFKDSYAAKIFEAAKDEMYNVYPLFSFKEAKEMLEKVYEFICRAVYLDTNPAVILALMTDKDVLALGSKRNPTFADLAETSVGEIIPHLQGRNIDFTDSDLGW